MAKRRTSPPKTPFGAWLAAWLEEHAEWTHQAFAEEVGVSKGLISQWTAGDVKRIGPENLAEVARVTGEPLANLERMVYGDAIRRPVASGVSPDLLDAIEERVRRAFREEVRAALREEVRAALREFHEEGYR